MKSTRRRPIFLAFTLAVAAIAVAQPSHPHHMHRGGTATRVIPCHRTTSPETAHEFVCNIIHSLAIRAAGPQ
jgi:hypothetical protein